MPRELAIHWYPLLPVGLIALLGIVLLAALVWGSRLLKQKEVPSRGIARLGVLRVLGVGLFLLCLLQPTFSYQHATPQRPELLLLVDTSQSMGLPYDAASGNPETRLQHALSQLHTAGLLDKLSQTHHVQSFAFDRQAYPVATGELNKLTPAGSTTQFARSIQSALELAQAQRFGGGPTSSGGRWLVVSDGNDQGSGAGGTADVIELARQAGVAIDVLPSGVERPEAEQPTRVVRVQAAHRVLLGSETELLVTLARGREANRQFTLTLFENEQPIQTLDVDIPALDAAKGSAEQTVTWQHRPSETGLKRYSVVLAERGAAAKLSEGKLPASERYAVDVQVVDDRVEVLMLEDRWRWEFKYLRRVLEDDPSFNFTGLLARGGTSVQFGEPERQVNLGGFPHSRAELDWFDVIVLGDVHPSRWPKGLAGALGDAVTDGGKSLVVIAGPAIGEIAALPELSTLLPVEITGQSAQPVEGPLDVRLTPPGLKSPLFMQPGVATRTELPAVDRVYPPLRKRPGATTLVETVREANASGSLIVIAEQTVGRGKVVYIGSDALWKWHTLTPIDNESQTLYTRFWHQALRGLTPRRLSSSGGLFIETERTRYEAGSRVVVQAEARLQRGEEALQLAGSFVLPDEKRLPLSFTLVEPEGAPSGGERYQAEFDAAQVGQYRLALSASLAGQTVAETSTAIEVIPPPGETSAAGVDRARLVRLAERTGGKVIDPADPQTWPDTSSVPQTLVSERRSVNLWENFSLLIGLCLVLGGDWLWRMLRGWI